MKKIVSTVLVCVLLVCTLLTLASCSKMLTGKYEADLVAYEETYEFGMFGKVTKTIDPVFGEDTVTEGKYEINDAGDKITLTFGEDSVTYDFTTGEEGGVEYIKIGLVKYTKVD